MKMRSGLPLVGAVIAPLFLVGCPWAAILGVGGAAIGGGVGGLREAAIVGGAAFVVGAVIDAATKKDCKEHQVVYTSRDIVDDVVYPTNGSDDVTTVCDRGVNSPSADNIPPPSSLRKATPAEISAASARRFPDRRRSRVARLQ
jgi:hypothetical protein